MCQSQLVDWLFRTEQRSRGYGDVTSIQEEGQICEEKNAGKDWAQTVFPEAPACLTQSCSQGPHVCSGIIRISSWWENKRDRQKMKHIPPHKGGISGIWHNCSFWLSSHSHLLLERVEHHSLRESVVGFGWVRVLCSLTLTPQHASVICVEGDPWHLDGTMTPYPQPDQNISDAVAAQAHNADCDSSLSCHHSCLIWQTGVWMTKARKCDHLWQRANVPRKRKWFHVFVFAGPNSCSHSLICGVAEV